MDHNYEVAIMEPRELTRGDPPHVDTRERMQRRTCSAEPVPWPWIRLVSCCLLAATYGLLVLSHAARGRGHAHGHVVRPLGCLPLVRRGRWRRYDGSPHQHDVAGRPFNFNPSSKSIVISRRPEPLSLSPPRVV